ncbi:hypothetical protein ScPMuIL_010091 [Solemya velum]
MASDYVSGLVNFTLSFRETHYTPDSENQDMALWGEMPVIPDTDSGIAAIEREQITKPRAMEVEGPRLHQPSSRHFPPSNDSLPAEKFQIDEITLHTIRLVQHSKKMKSLMQFVQQQQQDILKNGEGEMTYPNPPTIPEYTGPPIKDEHSYPVPYLPMDRSRDFVRGIGEAPPVIDDVACRKLLRRSVAAIGAHVGYDNSGESVLETLSDILHEYYLQFMSHLRSAADATALGYSSGFPDIIEQVFHEMGIGSVKNLHDFYQTRVIQYRFNMEQTCQQLMADYKKLKQPVTQKSPETLTLIRIKDEPCSEIHFPVMDETDEVNEAEQLLQLEVLGNLEITVEQESVSGLTTEVETKWPQGVKTEASETKAVSLEALDDNVVVKEEPPPTPQMSEAGDSNTDPGSVPVSDIMSPPSITSRPPKKKKKTQDSR